MTGSGILRSLWTPAIFIENKTAPRTDPESIRSRGGFDFNRSNMSEADPGGTTALLKVRQAAVIFRMDLLLAEPVIFIARRRLIFNLYA